MQDEDLVTLTADIVSAHVANNHVAVGDLGHLIRSVHGALAALGQPSAPAAPERKTPLVSVRASIKPDYLVCMVCGARHKMLKRHLARAHGLTPDQYRADYGLPGTYPMSAPSYSEQRRAIAKALGLGRKAGRGRAGRVAGNSLRRPAARQAGSGRGRA